MYVYQADVWCNECGIKIKQACYSPEGEADYPQHCGSGAECCNAISLEDRSIGCLLGSLTEQGVRYVQDAEGPIAELWADHFGIGIRSYCEGCGVEDDLNAESLCEVCAFEKMFGV